MDFFRGRLQASEGSHFKREQEDELKEYRRRRIREGAIDASEVPDEAAEGRPETPAEKLAEIHAQEVRVSVPADVLRKRVSAQMPPGDATRRGSAAAAWAGALGGAVGSAPRTSLGRNRWSLPAEAPSAPVLPLAEESAALAAQREVAQRALAAGTRALLYGSALATVLAVAAAAATADAYGIRSEADLRDAVALAVAPRAHAMRDGLAPWKAWLAERAGGGFFSVTDAADEHGFASRLRRTSAFRGLVAAAQERQQHAREADAAVAQQHEDTQLE